MISLDFPEILMGVANIAIALAGFSGVVVVFGSRSEGSWHPGDRLRLGFLLEASFTACGFALLALLLYSLLETPGEAWATCSALWVSYMTFSLYWSRRRILDNQKQHDDIDRFWNRVVFSAFAALIVVQFINAGYWQRFGPLLAALMLNVVGAAMQFARLIRSAFHE